ncbi:fimbrial protein [Morganella morganii]|uniref:fimbrial protein n=1 Tax=Morganella morganii TaxID=582 RepID=UPI001647A52D|nr:fimbrial protein [Morganella morganii]MBC3993995.1 fimbrial protein [Morganella morganii]
MKIKLLAALAALGMSGNALAVICTPVTPPDHQAEQLDASSDIIRLRADAGVGPDKNIGTAISTSLSSTLRYSCPGFEAYGERPLVSTLEPYPGYSGMYRTKIEGIGVKFTTSAPDGGGAGDLPRPRYRLKQDPDPNAQIVYVNIPIGRFNATFYKLSDDLNLSTRYPDSNLLFSHGIIGYNKLEDTNISIYSMNDIYIVSTPVCTVDKPLPVDFNTVNAADIRRGVVRPLQFGIVCKTDYGNYDVTARIKGTKITDDGKYIKVDDSKDNDESLIIEITDGKDNPIMVDNSTVLSIDNVKSGQKASFGWTAKLKKQDGKPYPAQGAFKASAIITLEIK